jgi:hypothetical protein
MPTIQVEVTFDLSDYLSNGGFGDGDDLASLHLGQEHKGLAVRILQEELTKAGLDSIKVESSTLTGMHNNCMIDFQVMSGDKVHTLNVEADADLLTFPHDETMITQTEKKRLSEAWSEAFGRFEEEVERAHQA